MDDHYRHGLCTKKPYCPVKLILNENGADIVVNMAHHCGHLENHVVTQEYQKRV